MRKRYLLAGVTAALAVPLVAATPASAAEASSAASSAKARSYSGRVSSVIDGDSIRVRIHGRTQEVRLIGVAASSGQRCYASQSKRFAQRKLDGRWITLKTDARHDQSDGSRLFAYIYVKGSLFNITSIRQGYAKERAYGPGYRLRSEFRAAERKAKAEHVGLWSGC
jgi:endonuclease YncB( thermonuclease family)